MPNTRRVFVPDSREVIVEMMSEEDFFARFGTPDTWKPMTKCGGEIGPTTTRDELIGRGLKPEATDEALRYSDTLRLRGRPATECLGCGRLFDTTEEFPTHWCNDPEHWSNRTPTESTKPDDATGGGGA